jgi:hypothetical protein
MHGWHFSLALCGKGRRIDRDFNLMILICACRKSRKETEEGKYHPKINKKI